MRWVGRPKEGQANISFRQGPDKTAAALVLRDPRPLSLLGRHEPTKDVMTVIGCTTREQRHSLTAARAHRPRHHTADWF